MPAAQFRCRHGSSDDVATWSKMAASRFPWCKQTDKEGTLEGRMHFT